MYIKKPCTVKVNSKSVIMIIYINYYKSFIVMNNDPYYLYWYSIGTAILKFQSDLV
jgi:hypothetical protein